MISPAPVSHCVPQSRFGLCQSRAGVAVAAANVDGFEFAVRKIDHARALVAEQRGDHGRVDAPVLHPTGEGAAQIVRRDDGLP